MIETVTADSPEGAFAAAARLLHGFNQEYGEPAPDPAELAGRLAELVAAGQAVVLVAHEPSGGAAVGVAVMRVYPSLWSTADEAYLAELYVVPDHRGRGHGRQLLTEALRLARERGADYAFLVTTVEDERARRLYEAAGFRRTEGEGGPLMLAYERDLPSPGP